MLLSLQVANLNANSEKEKLHYSRWIAKNIFKTADQTAEEVLGRLILHRFLKMIELLIILIIIWTKNTATVFIAV